MKTMNIYTEPVIKITAFSAETVLTASGEGTDKDMSAWSAANNSAGVIRINGSNSAGILKFNY